MKKYISFFSTVFSVLIILGAGCATSTPVGMSPDALQVNTLADVYKTYNTKPISEEDFYAKKLTEVFKVSSGRIDKPDYYEIVLTVFYSDVSWNDGKDHDMYILVGDDREDFHYYGPFRGNVKALVEEGKNMSKDAVLTDIEEFDSFEMSQ